MHHEVDRAAVTSMFNLGDVLELVDDGLDNGTFRNSSLSLSNINRFFILDLSRVISSTPWVRSWSFKRLEI